MTPDQRTDLLARALLEGERFDRYLSTVADQLHPPGEPIDDMTEAIKDLMAFTLAAQGAGAVLAGLRTLFQETQPDLAGQVNPNVTRVGLSLRASLVVGAPDTPEGLT